ncbi:MAG: DNA-3-methyladenine glycosylase 2 family protein [Clostridium sp.]|uniref:DNA-(apurinic or apyrimidinic site) lyase n=1 Tax=Clostridium paraputrificum TaxID=29363 RepID=A0A6N3CXV3_9CLOT|nr:DNA glycosylase [Clostridium sp.]MBS5927047.1 DNA-3-methyladenine glycosylase 2 family protein [Clostridium sp.]MBS5986071.1 DNA-3-methyladenine glycosylase 2 family protein [Clostridium sp.]
MDVNNIVIENGKVILEGVRNFNIKQILECGQCFRWEKVGELNYIGVAHGRVIEVIQENDKVTILNTNEEDFNNIWLDYFDLKRDYSEIKRGLEHDDILGKSVEYGYGIRLLNQEHFELLISFIISARNSIPSIMKTIKKISQKWGTPIEYKGNTYYTFPTPEQLKDATEEEIKETGASFRSKYIVDTIAKVNESSYDFDLDRISKLNADECHTALQNFKGVGSKVADCIMLFSMRKYSAFPVDVWVKRAMIFFYGAEDASLNKIRIFARDKFGELAGFAQQYLFYYARENKIKVGEE